MTFYCVLFCFFFVFFSFNLSLSLFLSLAALSAVRFSIVATSSQSPVLLLAGVPQNHYVEFAANEYFKFYPHSDEDLHITLTGN